MAVMSAAKPSDSVSARNSMAIPPSREEDQAYDSRMEPVRVAPYTTSTTQNAMKDVSIEAAARRPVHRSGKGRLKRDAAPSSVRRAAGDPTPTSSAQAKGTADIMRRRPH